MVADLKNPFTPGTAAMPPPFEEYIGRRSLIDQVLAVAEPLCRSKLEQNRGPHSDIILCGPEGIGKTVLLRKIELKLRDKFEESKKVLPKDDKATELTVFRWTLQNCRTRKNVLRSILPIGFWQKIREPGIKVRLFSIRLELNDASSPIFDLALKRSLENGPLVILIDDAQGMKPAIFGDLLDASQRLRNEGNPILFVFAGTDRLPATLNKINHTLVQRSTFISVGPLDEKSARGALARPLRTVGAEPRELDILLDEAKGQPYVLQRLGSLLVQRLNSEKIRVVTETVAEEVLQTFKDEARTQDHIISGGLDRDASPRKEYKGHVESEMKDMKARGDKLDAKEKRLEKRRRRIRNLHSALKSEKKKINTCRLKLNSDGDDLDALREDLKAEKELLKEGRRELRLDREGFDKRQTNFERQYAELNSKETRLDVSRRQVDADRKRLQNQGTAMNLEKGHLKDRRTKLDLEQEGPRRPSSPDGLTRKESRRAAPEIEIGKETRRGTADGVTVSGRKPRRTTSRDEKKGGASR